MPFRAPRLPGLLLLAGLTVATACSGRSHLPAAAAPAAPACGTGQAVAVTNGSPRDVDVYLFTPPAEVRTLLGTVPSNTSATFPLSPPPSGSHIKVWWTDAPEPDATYRGGLGRSDQIYVQFRCR